MVRMQTSDLPYKIAMIVGVPRSGTTFLQVLLAAHQGVVTARETHLFNRYLGPMLDRFQDEVTDLETGDGIRHHLNREALDAHFRSFALSVFSAIRAKSPDSRVVLEKTPIT